MYDLVVIGSGPAGEKGAAQAAYFGRRVALIEKEPVPGGACVNTGTIPSKTLRESALHLSGFRQRGFRDSVMTMHENVTVADLMYRKQRVLEREWKQIDDNLERHRVDRFQGSGRLRSCTEVEVGTGDGEPTVLETKIILIATGSSPFRPDTVPFDDNDICDSDTILNIHRIPESLVIIGAGVIGCEYASIFAALGVEVHLIDGRTSLLGFVDQEIVGVLLDGLRNRLHVKMHLGFEVEAVTRDEYAVTVRLKNGPTLKVDKLLYAAGRSSNTSTLNLEGAGVKTGSRGLLSVNEHYQTSCPNIYAAGDVIGFPALASTSMEQARVAMVHAFDLKYKTHLAATLPYGLYTIPEISTVGMTEEECVKKKQPFAIGRASFSNNARGQIIGDESGMIKLIFSPDDMKLLGVHIIGENASELLHVGMMVMQFDGTINAFIEAVFNFPTLGEAYKYAAYDGLGNVAREGVRPPVSRLRVKEQELT